MSGLPYSRTIRLRTIVENSFYKIEADHGVGLIRALWYQPISDKELVAGALKLREFMMESQLEYLLSNSQGLAALSADTKNWLADVYYETLTQTNLKKLARVTPTNLFHQIALESVVTRAAAIKNLSFEFRNFSSEGEALNWLLG